MVFLLLFRGLLNKLKIPSLKQDQWFKIVVIFMSLVSSVAIIGIVAWIYSLPSTPSADKDSSSRRTLELQHETRSGVNTPDLDRLNDNHVVNVVQSHHKGPIAPLVSPKNYIVHTTKDDIYGTLPGYKEKPATEPMIPFGENVIILDNKSHKENFGKL